jgi:exonuclease SbcC
MKILELRFKNLNSLTGEWCIDFTDPAFAADGLFAITGPTGSGKTTILDALCLALYGQTPRLGKLTQSDNEVMSRQTGECSAEVRFETAQGIFLASWHQHRARSKAGAALQAPRRELANAEGILLAEKLKEVQDQIDEVVGMGFERFTRSILLAQGSFDAFLKANANDRSPILEQITGTEIYTEISKRVHERNSAENQTLSTLKAGLDGIVLLSADELEQLAFDLKQIQEKHTEEAKKRDAAKAALDSTARIQTLEKEIENNRTAQQLWNTDHLAFQPDADRLAAAKRAQPLAVAHAELLTRRSNQTKIEAELTATLIALPAIEQHCETTKEAVQIAQQNLDTQTSEHQKLAPLIKQVRELDVTLQERSDSLKKDETQLKKQQEALCTHRQKQIENQTRLHHLQTQLVEAETYQKEHPNDATLITQLSAIFQTLETVEKQKADQQAAQKNVKTAAVALQKSTETRDAESTKRIAAQAEFTETETALKTLSENLVAALDGQTTPIWRTRLDELKQRLKIESQISTHWKTLQTKTAEAKSAAQELTLKQHEYEGLQREQALLLENLQLQKKIESLEDERAALADGQPCPLCGALDHPFVEKSPSAETRSIDPLNAKLNALATTLTQLTKIQTAAETLCESLRTTLQDHETDLHALAEGTADDAEQLAARVQKLETLEQEQTAAKMARDQALETLNRHLQKHQSATQTAQSDAEKLETASARLSEIETLVRQTEGPLFQTLERYGIQDRRTAVEELSTRRDHWETAQAQQTELTLAISNLQTQLDAQALQLETQHTQIEEQSEALKNNTQQLASLRATRIERFADRNPDIVEQHMHTALESARTDREAARTQQVHSQNALSQAQQKINTLQTDQQATAEQLEKTEPLFFQTLETAGFATETAWRAALLPEDERSALEHQADQLKQRRTQLTTLEAEKTQQLNTEREQQHIETSVEEHTELMDSCNTLQQQIGQLNSQIAANEKAKASHAEKLGTIEKQQLECTRWNQLHELIGSADGKKFRNFAQGLTFELMVSHANQQLAKMSDRYLLVRDKAQPLDLNVIDNYQAGEIRPVKNLSGGESFIVSLSLALGLSRMASKHIRVDSLFLDEGFGTLDEDALETALEALAELKQDGKLIGVISHVGALKERISTQINVEPTHGGRSRLSGVGVSAPSR